MAAAGDPVRVRARRRLHAAIAALALTAIAASGAALGRTERGTTSGGATAGGTAATVFAKGPYLQALGPRGVTVKVELASPGPASVAVVPAGDGGAAVASRESAEAASFHALRVEGLAPATAYEYRVTAGGAVSEEGRFTTAPADARAFRFLTYGDSRSDPEAHAAVIRAMEAVPSDFLVNTGDMVSMGNDPRDWRELFAIEGRMLRDRCVFVAVGNHELARGDPAGVVAFLRFFASADDGRPRERLYGTFRWSNTRFFVLNAMDGWTGDERAWLRAELDRALLEPGLAHRVAVMHWGPFSSGRHGNNPALANGEVVAMMRERKVDLVLAGHDHAYERGEGGGIKYVITGGAGAPLYPRTSNAPETLRYEAVHHFIEVAIDGDHVSITARLPSGGVLEACGYRGSGPWDCDAARPAVPPGPSGTAPAVPSRARSACGCAVPGAAGDRAGSAALMVAAALVLRRRRR